MQVGKGPMPSRDHSVLDLGHRGMQSGYRLSCPLWLENTRDRVWNKFGKVSERVKAIFRGLECSLRF